MPAPLKRLVLVGGGHAHLALLQALAREQPGGIEAILITPKPYQEYSGMLPGWMAGHYTREQCQINLQALALAARVQLLSASVVGMDAQRRCVGLADGKKIDYDCLSLDVGSEINASWLEAAGEKLLPVKPLQAFFVAWPAIVDAAAAQKGYRLVVVGGGAAGVELALAARHALRRVAKDAQVALVVSGASVLPGHAHSVQQRVLRFLKRAGVAVHLARAAGAPHGVVLADGTQLPANTVIAATGARAPFWLETSKLALDEHGYVSVDGHHQSVSHPNVFAAGDVCARQDTLMARSGVHAVRAGPVLAANVLAALKGGPMRVYHPRRRSLYLIACGPRYAIASWGAWSAEGAWVWRWKDWIDRGFVKRWTSRSES